jgi:hypothetical protein
MSAMPRISNITRTSGDVRDVPGSDICTAAKAPYSITSSAMDSSPDGTSMPSARAVWRLMANSNLVDCRTGRSAGNNAALQNLETRGGDRS